MQLEAVHLNGTAAAFELANGFAQPLGLPQSPSAKAQVVESMQPTAAASRNECGMAIND